MALKRYIHIHIHISIYPYIHIHISRTLNDVIGICFCSCFCFTPRLCFTQGLVLFFAATSSFFLELGNVAKRSSSLLVCF